MESIFVLIPPRGCSPCNLQKVRTCLTGGGAQIETEASLSSDALQLRSSQLAVLFGSAHRWSMSPSHEVLLHPFAPAAISSDTSFCPAEDDLKSMFFSHYGELWDAAVEEKRLQTAFDVLTEENITVAELEQLCVTAAAVAHNVLELPAHLTITKLSNHGNDGSEESPARYVVNGVYPAQRERFFQADADHADCWWCTATLPSSPSAPQQEDRLDELQRLSRDIEDLFPSCTGVRVVTNPLEALAYRVLWMHTPLTLDAFASKVLQQGPQPRWLEALLRDPVVHDRGQFFSVFEMVRDKSVAEVVDALAQLWGELKQSATGQDNGDVANGAPALYDYEKGCLSPSLYTMTADVDRVHAVVFAHPRVCACEGLSSSLQQQLDQRGIEVDAVRQVSVDEMQAKLDLHFDAVARYALDQEALRHLVADETDAIVRFEESYGVSWQQAMDEGRLWSVPLAEDLLGCQQAQSLLRRCLSQGRLTQQLSPVLAITKVSRQALISEAFPDTSLGALFSTASGSQRPYALMPDTFFIANAAYAVYRRDLFAQMKTEGVAGEVWQLSWPKARGINLKAWQQLALSTPTSESPQEEKNLNSNAHVEQMEASYGAAVSAQARQMFPLLNVVDDPALALRARHLWWGTPYDEDELSLQLRAKGQSWVSLLPPPSSSSSPSAPSAELAEAVLVLPPRVAANHIISLTSAVLRENDVTVVEETDVYGEEAAAYVFGGNSLLAAASALAHKGGAALWAQFPRELQRGIAEVAEGIRAAAEDYVPILSAENLIGGATACVALQITSSDFEAAWQAAQPRRVDRTCWLAFFPRYDTWVVNGHVAVLEHRYSMETARVHLMRIRWPATSKSWADMRVALLGVDDDVMLCGTANEKSAAVSSSASTGSLALLLSRAAEKSSSEKADAVAPAAEPLCLLSSTPYDALIDVLRWPHQGLSSPMQSEVGLEDWLLRQPYVRAQLTGSIACSLTSVVQQVWETLASVVETRRPLSSFASTPRWISRIAQSHCEAQLHHGFIWLHPSSVTPLVLDALPHLLLQHRVHIRASGVLPLAVVTERQLLDVYHDGFYKNAYVRTAAQVPITDAESKAFAASFGQSWIAAVQLGLVLNAQEAEQKYGAVHLTTWWNCLPDEHQARLSSQLFVGYMAEEGIYVMNPPYSYHRSRLYTGGSEVVWYAVEWSAVDMTWDDFMLTVVGDADPANALPGSLRSHFGTNWIQYSLPGKPDQIECVLHASDSPLAALAERCRWLDCPVEHDPYGQVLLHSGVHSALLSQLLTNPTLYMRGTGITAEAFHLLQQEDVHELVLQLRAYECRSGFLAVPDSVTLIPSPAMLDLPKETDYSESDHENALLPVAQLRVYRDVASQKAIDFIQRCSFAKSFSDKEVPQSKASNSLRSAVMYLDPLGERPVSDDAKPPHRCGITKDALHHFLKQHLRRHGIRVVHERLIQCANEAEATVLHRMQHHRLYRYGIEMSAAETLANNVVFQAKMKQHFDVSLQDTAVMVRNAAEMAEALRANAHDVAVLWTRAKRLYPRDTLVLSDDCVVQRLHPRQPFFLINGDAMEAEQQFAARQAKTGALVWYLEWDAQEQPHVSHAQLAQIIAGLQGARGPLCACWSTYGWDSDATKTSTTAGATAPDLYPSLHVSESSLAAVRQRQLWLGLPMSTDPIVRGWLTATYVKNGVELPASALPLCAIAWALRDPLVSLEGKSDAQFLLDMVVGLDAARVRERLHEWWTATQDGERNTAVVALMPQAAASVGVRHLVRSVIAENNLRMEEHGFVAHCGDGDGEAKVRRIIQYLYPEDWSYATQEPHLLVLSPEECDRVADMFKTSWTSMRDSGRVLPASRATKRLGGMSPAQLQLFVKASKKAMWVRPHLHVAELEEYGVFVVNAHVAHLSGLVAAAAERLPLPYYVVSWNASQCSWEECVSRVVGSAELSLASPQSIRGRVNTAWSALGLHAAPTMGGSLVCMSDGPLHGLLARLNLSWPAMEALDEDVFGGLLLQSLGATATVMPVLHSWLSNPTVTCDGRTDGVLSHLANWETEEVLRLLRRVTKSTSTLLPANLSAIRQAEKDAEGQRAAEAAWKAAVQQRDSLPVLLSSTATATAGSEGSVPPDTETEDVALLHRNVGTLLFLSSQLSEKQRAQLRQHLQQYGVSVSITAEEEEQEATPELLDRLFATEHHLASCANVAQVLSESGEVTVEDQERFNVVFREGIDWHTLLERSQQHAPTPGMPCGLYSAADAMRNWEWTPHDLWKHVRSGLSMRLSESIEITRLSFCRAEGRADETAQDEDIGEGAELSSRAETPWAGHYVLNGAYAALRDALQEASSAAAAKKKRGNGGHATFSTPLFTMWEVSWDSRMLSWQDFVQQVIGCVDCERAAPDSFNALLRRDSSADARESAQLATPLSYLGVVPASGPLEAFAMRNRWCRNARNRYNAYVPDPFVRAMAMASVVDQIALLGNWVSNPLVMSKGGGDSDTEVRCRLFDLTRNCDAPQVIQWLRGLDAAAASAAHSSTEDSAADRIAAEAALAEDPGSEREQRAPPLPPPRMKKQFNAARVRDALLHAREESDWRRLWDYYGALDASVASTASDTISFAPFYRDFRSLDTLGVPNMSHELKQLFLEVEVGGRGRMTYAQFTQALTLYQTL
ncbi:hypothetical protein ABL78_2340 [Leptomonas seymouri]|uniref:Uncharacterized protein n=1 Tax=Leptomonas seymouri TaxID=5684 RepID=A0A0N1ILY3_LEPSE|nr:hypothetical protein ABL78_2340 [Leptomonas seymouri]|eukprot:KPI88528.1 hypothetical protein ABL78_2340 [Leptomonas seymouri]